MFETKNNISVNVLAVEGRYIYIHRKTNYQSDREINLLMISEDGVRHYTAIKSLSRLLRSSNTKHKCKQYFCTNCLQSFTLESSRDEHQVYCRITRQLGNVRSFFCDQLAIFRASSNVLHSSSLSPAHFRRRNNRYYLYNK